PSAKMAPTPFASPPDSLQPRGSTVAGRPTGSVSSVRVARSWVFSLGQFSLSHAGWRDIAPGRQKSALQRDLVRGGQLSHGPALTSPAAFHRLKNAWLGSGEDLLLFMGEFDNRMTVLRQRRKDLVAHAEIGRAEMRFLLRLR